MRAHRVRLGVLVTLVWTVAVLAAPAAASEDAVTKWDELTLFANDFRAIPGAVVVMGHVEGRLNGEPIRRGAACTFQVQTALRRMGSPLSRPST